MRTVVRTWWGNGGARCGVHGACACGQVNQETGPRARVMWKGRWKGPLCGWTRAQNGVRKEGIEVKEGEEDQEESSLLSAWRGTVADHVGRRASRSSSQTYSGPGGLLGLQHLTSSGIPVHCSHLHFQARLNAKQGRCSGQARRAPANNRDIQVVPG